jgi:PAS domain S-box-containing protein
LGITLIQRGHLKYFNKKFAEIFRYSKDEISKWKKREFYKIIHPEDLPNLLQNINVDGRNTVSIRFRGVTKDNKVIELENYVCVIKFNNKNAYLSSYMPLEEIQEGSEAFHPKTVRIHINKRIVIDYNPDIVKVLRNNKIVFDIIEHYSYREDD